MRPGAARRPPRLAGTRGAVHRDGRTALIYSGDAETALQEARRAVEIANRAGDPTTRALAINAEGRALVQLGQDRGRAGAAGRADRRRDVRRAGRDGHGGPVLQHGLRPPSPRRVRPSRSVDPGDGAVDRGPSARPVPGRVGCTAPGSSGSEARGTMPNARLAERAKRSARSPEPSRDGRWASWDRSGSGWGTRAPRTRSSERPRRDGSPAGHRAAQTRPGRSSRPTRRSGKPWSDRRRPTGSGRPTRSSNGPRSSRPRWTSRSPSATSSGRVGRPRSSTGFALLRIQGDQGERRHGARHGDARGEGSARGDPQPRGWSDQVEGDRRALRERESARDPRAGPSPGGERGA